MRFVLALASLVLVSGWNQTANAHGYFVVNTTADTDDGSCDEPPVGDCSLREAIDTANVLINDHPDAPDVIAFDFGEIEVPPFTILLESPLPSITESLIINGSTEPRYIVGTEHLPVIIVDGDGVDEVLRVRAENTLVLAIAITNAAVSGIDAESADYLLVRGCYLGVHPLTGEAMPPGSSEPAFGSHAIHVRDTYRPRIGGPDELSRNLISGAGAEAVLVERSDNLVFHGNYIGLDPAGLEARPNALENPLAFAVDIDSSDRSEVWDNAIASNLGGGIRLRNVTGTSVERNKIGVDATGRLGLGNAGPGLTIGSDSDGMIIFDNVISANAGHGISCLDGTLGPLTMKRNLIGVDIAKGDVLPNEGDGIHLESGCSDALIGSENPNQGNLIAHNGGVGIRAMDGTALVQGNALFLNEGLAIDAGPTGRTDNDVSDELLPTNYPEVTGFELEPGELHIHACVSPGAVIDVYEALTVPGGTPGTLRPLASAVEGSEEDGDASDACSEHNEAAFALTLPIEESVDLIVLTATVAGHTSELSDSLDLNPEAPGPGACASGADCSMPEPICDLVFRRCVYCVDDEADDSLDSGCSSETPRCVQDTDGRRCLGPEQAPPRSRPPVPAAPVSGSRCEASPMGESSAPREAWLLLVCAVGLIWRRAAPTNT